MCLIVDNNVVARVFDGLDDPDFGELFHCLFQSGSPPVRIVYGGKLRREYLRSGKVQKLLVVLDRAGRARAVPDTDVDREEETVHASGLCISDDPHVIALARVGGVRVLCSHDQDLHEDFTNKRLLDGPRGKVYQGRRHRHLLVQACTQ
jgi:hypothetical protein